MRVLSRRVGWRRVASRRVVFCPVSWIVDMYGTVPSTTADKPGGTQPAASGPARPDSGSLSKHGILHLESSPRVAVNESDEI